MTGFDTTVEWIRDLRKRSHEHGNHISRIEGEMLADRRVAEERHRTMEAANKEFKSDIATLTAMITQQTATMNQIEQGQKSILQTMDSDRQTRIETAAALEAADKARRERKDEPWITPNRVIVTILGVLGIGAAAKNGTLG